MVSKEYASIIRQTLKMYLLLAVSSLSGGMQNLLLGGYRFSSCGAWALEHVGSVITAHGLTCSLAHEILAP